MTQKEQRKALLHTMKQNQAYPFLILLALVSVAGLQAWRTLFNNFAVDEVFLNGLDVGTIQAVRELPGFLTFLVIYVLLLFREHRLAVFSVILMGVGMSVTGFFPSLGGLLITTFIFSLGFHYFEAVNQSLTLQHFSTDESPFMLARVKSYSGIVNIVVGLLIFFFASWMSLKLMYLVLGIIIIALACYALFMKKDLPTRAVQRKRIMIKSKYRLYYILSFLSGARRQVFVVFAVFMLVKKYEFSVQQVTMLFVLNNVLTFFVYPYIARGIRKFGERKMLSWEYASLFVVFLGYAVFDSPIIAALLYVLDHLFFGFAMGINTYFQKIAKPEDIAPSISTAYAINHISAIVIPIIGGALWLLNWRIPFIAGAVLAVVSFGFVQKIKIPEK
ncbi:MAG: MFS transporter [Bacteroidota bacterium]|nr:MFS transporter [Bacteroidota bacterium]